MVEGTVTLWNAEQGWGAVASPQLQGEAWVHFSVIEGSGYVSLSPGQPVTFTYEPPARTAIAIEPRTSSLAHGPSRGVR